jgi:hypothetical protein
MAVVSVCLSLAGIGCGISAPTDSQDDTRTSDLVGGSQIHGRRRVYSKRPKQGPVNTDGVGRVGETAPIRYHQGDVMTSSANKIYFLWYGNWAGDTAPAILDNLAQNLGGSPFYSIVSTYYDKYGTTVPTSIAFGGEIFDSGSLGTSLGGSGVLTLITNAITSGQLPRDPNGVYLVLGATNVTEGAYCDSYCGYHSWQQVNGTDIKYGYVGNGGNGVCVGCADLNGSPNQNPGADGMATVITHEVSEMITDPHKVNSTNAGWYDDDPREEEMADKCKGFYGTEYTTANGGTANVHLGNRDYQLEMLWIQGVDGMCANALTPATLACTNGQKDGDETDVDCGGSCPACALASHCHVDTDCQTGACLSGACSIAYCTDGTQNYDETDQDCGGPSCPTKCSLNKKCLDTAQDCTVGACLSGHCLNTYCSDGIRDYDEAGTDCGGPSCPIKCPLGTPCHSADDCAVGACLLRYCSTDYCLNGLKDYDETDLNCGGPSCAARCAVGKACKKSSDCVAGSGCPAGTCVVTPAYCSNGTRDGDEADTDCGGPSCANKCPLNSHCHTSNDCAIGACLLGRCMTAYCSDSTKDYDETDVNCGGPSCTARCAAGKHCTSGTDCVNQICYAGICQ